MTENLDNLRNEIAIDQKKGLPFIITSVVIWTMIFIAVQLKLPIHTKNMIVFCCSCPLMPLAWCVGKIINVDIFSKDNPLSKLGILFTLNQLLYLLIVMWAFNAAPEKMVMIYAIVFGAHLLPYSWLYKSASYRIFAIVIPILALAAGCMFSAAVVAGCLAIVELTLVLLLFKELEFLDNRR